MGRRRNSLRRSRAFRNPKPKIFIVSEGRLTEPDYFYSLARSVGALVNFEIVVERGAGVPLSIVNKAVALLPTVTRLTSFSRNDTVWAVFDRDQHPNFDHAINKAETAGVKVAFSVPCFELWLMLHVQDWDRPTERQPMQRALKKVVSGYDPRGSKRVDFTELADNVDTAISRAKLLQRRRMDEGMPRGNPITTVFHLVEHMSRSKR